MYNTHTVYSELICTKSYKIEMHVPPVHMILFSPTVRDAATHRGNSLFKFHTHVRVFCVHPQTSMCVVLVLMEMVSYTVIQ